MRSGNVLSAMIFVLVKNIRIVCDSREKRDLDNNQYIRHAKLKDLENNCDDEYIISRNTNYDD